jgi:hypothetical protein
MILPLKKCGTMTFFLFLSTVLFGPANNYYSTINAAELDIAGGRYVQAMQRYDTAFAVQPLPLAQDLYNASVCAARLNAREKCLSFCLQLADKGIPPSFFTQKSCYNAIRQSPHWAAFIKEATARQIAFKERNRERLELMQSLLTRSDLVYRDYQANPRSEHALTEYKWAGDSLCKIVLHYLNESGYLSEDLFGVTLLRDTILDARPVFYRLMHRRPLLVNVHLDSVFLRLFYQKGVNTGRLKPEQAVALLQGRLGMYEDQAAHYFTLYGKDLYRSSTIAPGEAAAIRRHLGLPAPDEELVKIKAAMPRQADGFLFNVYFIQQRGVHEPPLYEQQFLGAHTLAVKNIAPDAP